jgi:hypothetical protein
LLHTRKAMNQKFITYTKTSIVGNGLTMSSK